VFYDGGCGLCASTRAWAKQRDTTGRLQFVNFRDAAVGSLPVPRERLEREMWVRRSDGELRGGFDGICAVLSALPRWRPVGVLLGLPPVRWLGIVVYRIVARHRGKPPAG